MARVFLMSLVVAVVLFSGLRHARAYTCGGPSITLLPGTLEVAPTNTHVWIYIPHSFVRTCDRERKQCTDSMRIELRTAPVGRDRGTVVPTRVRRMETDADDSERGFVIEMIPRAELQPSMRYEVWSVGIPKPHRESFMGTLRTGKGRDDKPPTWPGAKRVAPIVYKQIPGRVTLEESSGLNVYGPRAVDGEGRVLYAAWKGEVGSPIDFSRPPDGYAMESNSIQLSGVPRVVHALMVLGWPGGCEPSNFAVAKGKEIRIGLRAVDLAGNFSAPSEHRVKLP